MRIIETRADLHSVAPNQHLRSRPIREGDCGQRQRRQDDASVVDFGCGSGELVRRLASLGHQAEGFEQGEDYSAFAPCFY